MHRHRIFKSLPAVLASLALAGCASFHKSQTNLFVDEDGYVVSVDYGTRSKDHVFMMPSPGNGQLIEIKSRLMVKALLPNGDSFTAYECLNPLSGGTMYMSDDERWKYLAYGFNCVIYERLPDGSDYAHVFDGVLAKGDGK